MMKFGVADFGMNVWDGGNFDAEARWGELQRIGYDGVERLTPVSADDAVYKAARMRRLSVDFGTVLGPTPETSLQWTAAFGKSYMWVNVSAKDFDGFCRQVNGQVARAGAWGVKVGLHNHMGTLVETQPQLEEFLACCPECGLLLDTAHLAAMGGDPVAIARKYADRLVAVHLKDYLRYEPEQAGDAWHTRGRFCALGTGNIGLDNLAVMRTLVEVGYDGWIFVEQDTHLQDPLIDLAHSRAYLYAGGF